MENVKMLERKNVKEIIGMSSRQSVLIFTLNFTASTQWNTCAQVILKVFTHLCIIKMINHGKKSR